MGYRGDGNPRVLSSSRICGDSVVNSSVEKLGKIEELMIDLENGRVAYAVLSFGGFLGIGDKLFAIPFEALDLDAEHHRFVLDVSREDLENGRVAYAVLSFGGFLGIGDKLFAIPFEALDLDAEHHRFVLDVSREKL